MGELEVTFTDDSNGLCVCDRCHKEEYLVAEIPCYRAYGDGEPYSTALCIECLAEILQMALTKKFGGTPIL